MKKYIRSDHESDTSIGQAKDPHELALDLRYMGVDGLDILEFFMDHLPTEQCYDLLMQLADERGIDV